MDNYRKDAIIKRHVVYGRENFMKIFDMHIHSNLEQPTPARMLAEMEKAGVYGGCVFSEEPGRASFEER